MPTPSIIAAQMFTLRDFCKTPLDIAKSCAKLKAKGFDAVQASGLGPIDKKELAKIFSGEGLQCAATHESWERLDRETEKVAEEHHILGCKHTAPGALPESYRSPEGYPLFAAALTKVSRDLAKFNLTLSYHNHAFELERFPKGTGKTGLEILIEKSDPKVNFEIDTYWIQFGGGDPAAWIKKVKNRIPLLHLKDMTVRANKPIMTEVGEGNLNWPAILVAAKEAAVEWYIIEQDVCERDPFDSLGMSLNNLKSWGIS